MMADYLGNLAAVSLNRAAGIRPRLAARFERPLAPAGLTPPALAEPEPAAGKPAPAASIPDVSPPQPVVLPAEPTTPPIQAADLDRPTLQQPAARRNVVAPVPGESPAIGQARVQRPVAVKPEVRLAPGPDKSPPAAPPVKTKLEAPQDRERPAPSQASRPQQPRAEVAPALRPAALPPTAEPPAPSPPATPAAEPASQSQRQAASPPQPPIQPGPSRRQAARMVQPAGQQSVAPASQPLAEAAPAATQAGPRTLPEADEPVSAPGEVRPAWERDLARPDATWRETPATRKVVREAIRPLRQAQPEGPSAPATGSGPIIRVTIGRIEVRANAPQPQATRVATSDRPSRRQPPLPLADYLKRRNQGHGGHR